GCRRPRHWLHPGLRDRRQPLPRPFARRCVCRCDRLRSRRAAARLRARPRRGARARPLRRATPVTPVPAAAVATREIPLATPDGHRYALLAHLPEQAERSLLWLPALGVAAKHYVPFAQALAARGVAVFLHEWRGNGSSSLRPDRD